MRSILTTIKIVLAIIVIFMIYGCDSRQLTDNVEPRIQSVYECDNCPALSIGVDTMDFVNDVRRFVAENADAGFINNSLCKNYDYILLDTFPVQSYLDIFEEDLGTATSGLCAKLMVKILLGNGIDAYSYSFGPKETNSPVTVVLVKQGDKLLVVNPRANYTLLDTKGDPMDLFSMIQQIGANNLEYRTTTDKTQNDLLIDFANMPKLIRDRVKLSDCKELLSMDDTKGLGVSKIIVERCYECERMFCKELSMTRRMEAELRANSGLSDFHEGIVLKRKMVVGAQDAEQIDDRIETAIYSQPNLGKRINGKLVN